MTGSNLFSFTGSDRLKDVGWFEGNSGSETKPVGQKQSNQLGIHDMSGNVREWCEDWYGGTKYYEKCREAGIVADSKGPDRGDTRVSRGGSWNRSAEFCRAADRFHITPKNRNIGIGIGIGFRLAHLL